MKKIFVTLGVVIITTSIFSQQIDSLPVLTKQEFIQKSKSQKKTAMILLTGGVVMNTIGMTIVLKETADALISLFVEEKKLSSAGPAFLIAGTVSVLSSIPLFIASNRNKKEGLRLSIKNENTFKLQNGGIVKCIIPSLSLKIEL